jgi:hypothetical protein
MGATSMIWIPVVLSLRSISGLRPSTSGDPQVYGCGSLGERYCACKKVLDFPYYVWTLQHHWLSAPSVP